MFLKSLEIFGFKSFPDKVKIEFAEGITALLGPNGCGKSNVVDAVKWVLGEQAPRSLRAPKWEDVIFNGTDSRKPLNVAEVTLTISNETGLLNLDVSEIAIKRRMFRSGETECYINNQIARLKDIKELFWDTGVGKIAYSVMEQGKIDQILSSKPEERRYLFEEAAGITKFKIKRQEAERNLEKTEENMRQVEAVSTEVKRSYETLKVQAEKTEKYRCYKEQIFEHELDIQLLRLRQFNDDLAAANENIKEITKRRNTAQAEIDGINSLLSENIDIVNEMESKFASHQKDILQLEIERREKDNQLQLYARRCREIKSKLEQLEMREKSTEDSIEALNDDVSEKSASVYELKKRFESIEKNVAEFEDKLKEAIKTVNFNKSECTRLEAEIKELESDRLKMETLLQSVTEDLVTELDKKLRAAGYSSKNRLDAEKSLQVTLEKLKTAVAEKRAFFSSIKAKEDFSESSLKEFLCGAQEGFTELETLAENIEKNLENYKTASANFIDDFLAPEGIITKKRSIDKAVADSRAAIENARNNISELSQQTAELEPKIEDYRTTLEALKMNKIQVQTQAEGIDNQIKLLERQLLSSQNLLTEVKNEIFAEEKQLTQVTEDHAELEGEIGSIEYKGRKLAEELEKLEKDISAKNSDLSSKRKKLEQFMKDVSSVNTLLEKHQMSIISIEADIRNIKENFREIHSRELLEFEERMFTITASVPDLKIELTSLKQKLKDLGSSINLMAPEEFQEVKERYEFLNTQIKDLDKARIDLKRITDEIKTESTELFLETYNKIKKNFHNMFRRLFGYGGRAEIRLTDPKEVLESGIEIFAQPPGKKLENIGLLSGGEKSMTAVALLFATYMVKPSPFCLLDEIDAALDEQNVTRFITTLRDFANVSQYIVITHNKKTVLGANTMLGVTMEESGVSKVITMKLDSEAELIKKRTSSTDEPFIEEEVEPEEGVYIPPHPPKRIKTLTEENKEDTNG